MTLNTYYIKLQINWKNYLVCIVYLELKKKNYEYFVLAKNNNFLKNLYFDFVVQRFFLNNFLKDEKNVNNILISTKKFIVDQPELRKYFASINKDENYDLTLNNLTSAKGVIFDFFDNIVVNDDDKIIRKNRLELLQMLCKTFENYINFSKIESV